MNHFCIDLDFNSSPMVRTLCGAVTDLSNGAKVVWEGVDCVSCLQLAVKQALTLRARNEKLEKVAEAASTLVGPDNIGKTVDTKCKFDGSISAVMNGPALSELVEALAEFWSKANE